MTDQTSITMFKRMIARYTLLAMHVPDGTPGKEMALQMSDMEIAAAQSLLGLSDDEADAIWEQVGEDFAGGRCTDNFH